MNAASLVQLAAAHGVDLNHVAGASTRLDGIAGPRGLTEIEKKIGIREVRQTASGHETRSFRRPSWTAAELSQAAHGLGAIPWAAALYSFAGARDGYWMLWGALTTEAHRIARRESWTPHVTAENGEPRFYRERLAQLVLDHDAHPHLFAAAPALLAHYMGVRVETWDRELRDPFRSLKTAYDRWLGTARSAIGRWIRREE